MLTHITGREWRAVAVYTLAIIVLTSLPYLSGWRNQTEDWQFSGYVFGGDDYYSYMGKMRLGVRGLWDFYLFYTPEPHASVPLIFLPYIIPGQVIGTVVGADDPGLQQVMAVTFHLLRAVFDALLIVVLYRFIAEFVRKPGVRLTALVLATVSGGLGWLLIVTGNDNLLGSLPLDLYLPEGYSFLILYGLPHLALARAAILGGLICVFVALRRDSWLIWSLLAALCWSVAALAVPFYLAIIYVILGGWGLAAWLRERAFPLKLAVCTITAAALTIPLFLFYAVAVSNNEAFLQWSAQNLLPSPHPLHYVFGYVLLATPAAVGIGWAWRRARHGAPTATRYALLVGWTLLVPLLVYLPINVQRRMSEGVIVPLAILAAQGLYLWTRGWRRRHRPRWRRSRMALVIVSSLTTVFWLWIGLNVTAAPSHDNPLFRPADELAALAWLNNNSQADEIVLAAVTTGNILPAFTNLRPYMGHGPETLFYPQKTEQVELFFRGELSAASRESLYDEFNIRYIIYGNLERELSGGDESPAWADDLTVVYENDTFRIYEIDAS